MTSADFNHHVQALSEFEANVDKNGLSDLDNTGCEIYNDEFKELWTEDRSQNQRRTGRN